MGGGAKLLGINASVRKKGNSYMLLQEAFAAATKEKPSLETEDLFVGDYNIGVCTDCKACFRDGVCVLEDDSEVIIEKLLGAQGIIFASPVYFGYVTPSGTNFINKIGRLCGRARGYVLAGKLGGIITVARRWGLFTTFSQILFFLYNQRMIIPGTGTPAVLGHKIGDVNDDLEGLQWVRELGRLMALLIDQDFSQVYRGKSLPDNFLHIGHRVKKQD